MSFTVRHDGVAAPAASPKLATTDHGRAKPDAGATQPNGAKQPTTFDASPVSDTPPTAQSRFQQLAQRHKNAAASTALATHDATRTGNGSAPGKHDGTGIRRGALDSTHLVKEQGELAGHLYPPSASPPKGVSVRVDGDGTRVVTINVHEGVPGGIDMDDDSNESIGALRDIARYVNSIDPDVVLMQELTRHKSGTKPSGIEEQPSVLANLIRADDLTFAPAFTVNKGNTETGTAIFTRNGYTIDHAVNAMLPDGEATQPRGALVAKVVPPGGEADEAMTVIGTHLAHRFEDVSSRAEELNVIKDLVHDIQRDGEFSYEKREQGRPWWEFWTSPDHGVGKDFPKSRIIFGGDLNAEQAEVDTDLRGSSLKHVITQLNGSFDADRRAAATLADVPTTARRIDHIYTSGFTPTDADVTGVENHDLTGDNPPTDHKGFITQLLPRPRWVDDNLRPGKRR